MSACRTCFLAVLLALGISTPADAVLFCIEPTEPYCLDAYGTFDDEWSFRRCRDEVENYVADIDAYIACLNEEIDWAIDEADRVVERFNCRARGGRLCY